MATSKRARRLPLVWTCACVLAVPAGVSGQTVSGPAQQETPADSPQVQKPSSSLSDLFKDTVRDFMRLPSLESFALLSIGGVAAAWAHPVDVPVSRSLSAPPWLGAVLGKITVLAAIILFLQWRPAGLCVTRSRSLEG